jgi:serine/threonine-protein kinase
VSPISTAQVVEITEQVAEGLGAAHAQGVVHRDIKPENIFLTHTGTVKVMDFGIARGRDSDGISEAGVLAGTASYMAPEQATGFASAGPSVDLYALGVVAYELICGRVPFDHADLSTLLALHASAPPPPPSELVPGLSPALERELLRALAKDPADRHPDCRAFAAALREAWMERDLLG